jgi:transposase
MYYFCAEIKIDMYIHRNKYKAPSGKEYSTILLCESKREGKKVRKKTIANLSRLPEEVILSIENTLKSKTETVVKEKDIFVESCYDYGYVFVIEQLMRRLRINETLDKTLPAETAKLVKAMITGKLVMKGSKLSIFNWLEREPELAKRFNLDMKKYRLDDFYAALAVLNSHKEKLDKRWFRYHKPSGNCIYLYDITSVYFEGTENALSAFGYNRDGKKGKMQICVGLVTDAYGNPLRIEVFKGNTVDSQTVEEQILKLTKEFEAEMVIFVGDRGMRIKYNIENSEALKNTGLQFITGLTKAAIKDLIHQEVIQLNLFSYDLAEIETDDGERFVLSLNPDLEQDEQQYLNQQKEKTFQRLKEIKTGWNLRRLQNRDNELKIKNKETKNKKLKTAFTIKDIDRYKKQVNHAIEKYKMQTYFSIETIDRQNFNIKFNDHKFELDLYLCGKYVINSNVDKEKMTKEEIRQQYKNLQHVEHDFRDLKSDNICIRPVYHRNEAQTIGHVQICFYALVIIKELEKYIYPFLHEINSKRATRLSFNDMLAELTKIKMCELTIGNNVSTLKIPKLNDRQTKLFEILNLTPSQMVTTS